MKNRYKVLDDLVDSVFAVEIGLSDEECKGILSRMMENTEWRDKFSTELSYAFSEENFSWMRFFDEHDLYSAESEEDAREYAQKIFLVPLQSKEER